MLLEGKVPRRGKENIYGNLRFDEKKKIFSCVQKKCWML